MIGITWLLFNSVLIFVFLSQCCAKNYCGSIYCNNNKQHTLCKFQSEDPARHCVGYEKTIETVEQKQAILDKLNSRRNKVASGELRSLPRANSMMKLEWNEELEESAQRWANQCVKHNVPDIKDTCRDLGSVYVEQNIATIIGEAPGLTPLALVDVWYMELLNLNASVISRYERSIDSGSSHYDYFTQLVWAKSSQVGCGGVKFKERIPDKSNGKSQAIYRLVCNFAPGGNQINSSVYTTGTPCSNCPEGTCDSIHTSLCQSKTLNSALRKTEKPKSIKLTSQNKKIRKLHTEIKHIAKTSVSQQQMNSYQDNQDDDITPVNYFPHFHEFISGTLTTSTKNPTPCKDLFAMDNFVEILKKKLSTDPMFKDILQVKITTPENVDNNGFTDALALAGKIYSKDAPSTTTKSSNNNHVNSTLLVDLVEAVIFRNTAGGKINTAYEISTQPDLDVSPVRIQAELAEVRSNSEFTGHLFFPEDMDNDDTNSANSEIFYDFPTLSSVPDLIGDIRRTKATKDFLDEILESEPASEKHYYKKRLTKRNVGSNFVKHIKLKNIKREIPNYSIAENNKDNTFDDGTIPKKYKKSYQDSCIKDYVIKYSELLKKLALDLKKLKINDGLNCCGSSSTKCLFLKSLLSFVVLGIIIGR